METRISKGPESDRRGNARSGKDRRKTLNLYRVWEKLGEREAGELDRDTILDEAPELEPFLVGLDQDGFLGSEFKRCLEDGLVGTEDCAYPAAVVLGQISALKFEAGAAHRPVFASNEFVDSDGRTIKSRSVALPEEDEAHRRHAAGIGLGSWTVESARRD